MIYLYLAYIIILSAIIIYQIVLFVRYRRVSDNDNKNGKVQ